MAKITRYREGDEPIPGYRLVQWLGEGGMGEVWKAETAGGIEVALKVLYKLEGKGSQKEFESLQLVKRIRHPNLVPITAFWLKDSDGNVLDDSQVAGALPSETLETPDDEPSDGTTRGTVHMRETAPPPLQKTEVVPLTETIRQTRLPDETSENADGDLRASGSASQLIIAMGLGDSSLYQCLEDYRRSETSGIPTEELLEYFEASARAIDLLNNDHNIQHCDIKPQNILVVGGAAQVCDFGLAQALGKEGGRGTNNAFTMAYAAPEVLSSGHPSAHTDQYSLAISYCELRTGKLPYREETLTGVIEAKRSGTLELTGLTPAEGEVIKRATVIDPGERYESCLEFTRALRYAYEYPDGKHGTPSRLRQLAILAVLALVLATAIVGFVVTNQRDVELGDPRIAIIQEQIQQATGKRLFDDAWDLVAELPENMREVQYAKIAEFWRIAAKQDLDDRQLERASGLCEAILGKREDDAHTHALLLEVCQARVGESEKRLAEEDFQDGVTQLSAVLASLTCLASPEASSLVHRIHMLRADALARLDPPQWQEVKADLEAAGGVEAEREAALQAEYLVLHALVNKQRDRPLEDLKNLARLAEFTDVAIHLDDWQRKQVEDLQTATLESLASLPNLNDEQRRQVRLIWPGDVELHLLLARADRLRGENKFGDTIAILDEAAEVAADDASMSRIASLRALTLLQDPEISDKDALQAFRGLDAGVELSRLPSMAKEIFRRVSGKDQLVQPTIASLKSLIKANGATEESLRPVVLQLLKELVATSISQPANFQLLLAQCEQLKSAGQETACSEAIRAECLVRLAGEQLSAKTWEEAQALVDASVKNVAAVDKSLVGYVHLVQALVRNRTPLGRDLKGATEHVLLALETDTAALRVPRHRDMAVNVLVDAARQARTDEKIGEPAYTPTRAKAALRLLAKANDLVDKPSRKLLENLALASFFDDAGKLDDVLAISEPLLAAKDVDPQVVLVNAQAHSKRDSPEDAKLAVEQFARVLDVVRKQDGLSGKQAYQQIVLPAVKASAPLLGDKAGLDEETKKAIASIHATRGEMIRYDAAVENLYRAKAPQQAYDAFSVATSLAPNVRTVVEKGYALIEVPDKGSADRLKELQALGRQAIALDGEYQGSHGLSGYTQIALARRLTGSPKLQSEHLTKAIALLDKALELSQKTDDKYPDYLINRSMSHLEYGVLQNDEAVRKKHLILAAKDAESATKITSRRRSEYAWDAWGNAEESRAVMFGEGEFFALAMKRYQQAVIEASDGFRSRSSSMMNLARCRFHRLNKGVVQGSAARRTEFSLAQRELESALIEVADESLKGTLHYWVSRLQQLWSRESAAEKEVHFEKADQACMKAIEIAEGNQGVNWATYQHLWARIAASRGDKKAAFERAVHFIDRYRKAGLQEAVGDSSLLAVASIAFRNAPDLDQQVELVNKVRKELSEEKSTGQIALVKLLSQRALVLTNNNSPEVWTKYRELCNDDSEYVMKLARKVQDPEAKATSEGLAWAAKGMFDYREFRDPEATGDKQQLAMDAAKALQKAVERMSTGPDSWDIRIALGAITRRIMLAYSLPPPVLESFRKLAEKALLDIPDEQRPTVAQQLLNLLGPKEE